MEKKDILQELAIKKAISWHSNYLVMLSKINLTLYPCRAWALTLQEIGNKKDFKYIFSLGRIYGDKSFEILKKRVNELKFNIPQGYNTFESYLEIAGIGKVKEFKGKNEFKIIFRDNTNLKDSIEMYREKAMAPYFYAGVVTSFYNNFFNENKTFKPKINLGEVEFVAK